MHHTSIYQSLRQHISHYAYSEVHECAQHFCDSTKWLRHLRFIIVEIQRLCVHVHHYEAHACVTSWKNESYSSETHNLHIFFQTLFRCCISHQSLYLIAKSSKQEEKESETMIERQNIANLESYMINKDFQRFCIVDMISRLFNRIWVQFHRFNLCNLFLWQNTQAKLWLHATINWLLPPPCYLNCKYSWNH